MEKELEQVDDKAPGASNRMISLIFFHFPHSAELGS